MLSYAFRALSRDEMEKLSAEAFERIHNLMAAILEQGISKQLKRGLYREYVEKQEDLRTLRGKISMPETLRHTMRHERILTCEYDELSENNVFNRILKTTALLLIRHPEVDPKYRGGLKKLIMFFSGVEDINPAAIKWSTLSFGRQNSSYRLLLSLCQLVIEGLLLTNERGEHHLASFLNDQAMERLYEKFILEYYVKEHPELHASSSEIKWALDEGDGTYLPSLQSDVMLCRGKRILIIDAKYYDRTMQAYYDTRKVYSSHMQQIFTYVHNKAAEFPEGAREVSGMLLYAATDEAVQPDVKVKIKGCVMAARTLDLNREFAHIAAQLDGIAEEFLGGKE